MSGNSPAPIRNFETPRLAVRHWAPLLEEAGERRNLELALKAILTPQVMAHLPEPLQLSPTTNGIPKWVTTRDEESDVYIISSKGDTATLGLMILAQMPENMTTSVIHLGYLLSEQAWGRGYATELVSGLVNSFENGPRSQLVAGVDRDNTASIKVLKKSGFKISEELSTPQTDVFTCTVP